MMMLLMLMSICAAADALQTNSGGVGGLGVGGVPHNPELNF
jgi:hypothetical protein